MISGINHLAPFLALCTILCFGIHIVNGATPLVRLINGTDEHEGILQFHRPGEEQTWAYVCGDGIQKEDADVVCRELGFQGADSFENVTAFTRTDSNYTIVPNFWCDPEDKSISECTVSGVLLNEMLPCDAKAPRITCHTTRLYGGPDLSGGRVEVWTAGSWGMVCSPDFGDEEQSVVCKELRYARRRNIGFDTRQISNPDNITFSWGGVTCTGSEAALSECARDSGSPTGCSGDNEVAFASCSLTEEGTDDELSYFDVRLDDGPCETEGRLMVWGGKDFGWGTVCQEMITVNDARVICNQLGIETESPEVELCCGSFPKADAGVRKILDALNCTGDEDKISDCPHASPGHLSSCGAQGRHSDDVGIRCRACSAKSNIGLIVGVVFAIIFIIAIIVVLLVYFCYIRPRSQYHGVEKEHDEGRDIDHNGEAEPVKKDLEAEDLQEQEADNEGEIEVEVDTGV